MVLLDRLVDEVLRSRVTPPAPQREAAPGWVGPAFRPAAAGTPPASTLPAYARPEPFADLWTGALDAVVMSGPHAQPPASAGPQTGQAAGSSPVSLPVDGGDGEHEGKTLHFESGPEGHGLGALEAQALAALINEVLQEQASRHGVDLS
jgi:hypothetical protein